eukprot:6592519-Prorocentrum_lima.AAC.1
MATIMRPDMRTTWVVHATNAADAYTTKDVNTRSKLKLSRTLGFLSGNDHSTMFTWEWKY